MECSAAIKSNDRIFLFVLLLLHGKDVVYLITIALGKDEGER